VTAGDINGTGGLPGQVLTNTGAGANWSPAGGPAYANGSISDLVHLNSTPTIVSAVTVPAGTYQVTGSGTVNNYPSPVDYVYCALLSPANNKIADQWPSTTSSPGLTPLSITGLVQTGGGTITLSCYDWSATGNAFVWNRSLVVTQVASGTGSVTPAIHKATGTLPRGQRPSAGG
jgi:hypothetical protein